MESLNIGSEGSNSGMDSNNQIQQGEFLSEVSAEAVIKVSEELKKGVQAHQQAMQQGQLNNLFAKFLEILLENISDNNTLLELMYKNFFTDQKMLATGSVEIEALVSLYAPFFREDIVKIGLGEYFDKVFGDIQFVSEFEQYIWRARKVLQVSPAVKEFEKHVFTELLIEIGNHYGLLPTQDEATKNTIMNQIENEIYS